MHCNIDRTQETTCDLKYDKLTSIQHDHASYIYSQNDAHNNGKLQMKDGDDDACLQIKDEDDGAFLQMKDEGDVACSEIKEDHEVASLLEVNTSNIVDIYGEDKEDSKTQEVQ